MECPNCESNKVKYIDEFNKKCQSCGFEWTIVDDEEELVEQINFNRKGLFTPTR